MVLYLCYLQKDHKTTIGNQECWKKMTVMVTKQMMTAACSACLTPTPPHCIRSNKAGGVAGGGCELRGNAEVTQKFLRNSCKNSYATYAEPGEIDQLNWNGREREPWGKLVGTFCIVWGHPQMSQSKTAPRIWKCICIGHTTHNCALWSLFEDWGLKNVCWVVLLTMEPPYKYFPPRCCTTWEQNGARVKEWNNWCNSCFAGTVLALHALCFEIPAYHHQDIFERPKSPCLAPQNTTIFVRVLCNVYWRLFVTIW